MFSMHGLGHHINVPTRIISNTKSCVDNILTDNIETDILDVNISEHVVIFVSAKNLINDVGSVCKRNINKFSIGKFLDNLNWENSLQLSQSSLSSNELTNIFVDTFMQIVSNCLTLITATNT